MNFEIKFLDEPPVQEWGVVSQKGQITIGDFKETFFAPIKYWDTSKYIKSW